MRKVQTINEPKIITGQAQMPNLIQKKFPNIRLDGSQQ